MLVTENVEPVFYWFSDSRIKCKQDTFSTGTGKDNISGFYGFEVELSSM